MSEYGFPYSGSKSKLVESLAMNFPKADHFYDLFGGGGSFTHYLCVKSKKYKHIHYNEIDPIVFDLFKKAINGDFNNKRFKPEWISREDFFKRKETDSYIKYIYSFSNNGQSYQFGPDIEPYKKSMHMAVVFDEFDSLSSEVLGFSSWPENIDTIYKKRIYLRQKIEFYRVNNRIPKILYQFLNERQLRGLQEFRNVQQLQQLQQLERLEQLDQLEQYSTYLTFTNLDYRDVKIENNSVVYCDIPYLNAAKNITYNNLGFNHLQFYEWALSRKFPVYISEYVMPDEFKCIYSFDKRNLYSHSLNKNNIIEKLFWNGVSHE